MPTLVLTQKLIDGALAPGEYLDRSLPNFGVRVRRRRRGYFVRVREGGRRIRVELGRADGLTAVTLKAARKLGAEKLRQHDEGKILRPPIVPAEALDVGAYDAETITVRQLCDAFLLEHGARKQWSPAHKANSEFHARRLVIPAMGELRARTLTRAQIKALIYTYAKRAPVNANRLHAFLSKLCRWAVREEYLEQNPMDQLEKPTVEAPRERELTPDEIVRLWAALDAIDANETSTPRERALGACWRLRLLTAQREQSIRRLEWAHVNFEDQVVEIPGANMKGRTGQRRPNVVPLGPLALKIFEARKAIASPLDKFVFGTRTGAARPPVRPRGVPVALEDFQGHDLRRTATTLMTSHGISEFDVDRVLAHKPKSLSGRVYNRYEYLAEKRVALELLDRLVAAILDPETKQSASVLAFVRA